MRCFVTGGTGFIGLHLVRRLVSEGHEVRCLVRKHSRIQPLQALGVDLVVGDVNDRAALREGLQGCDWLFHLANLYSMWEPDRRSFHRVNVEGTRNVLETALEAGVKKAIYISTVAVYGKPAEVPFREDSQHGPRLFSEYARSKALADAVAWDLARRGLPLVVFYPGIVLGAGDDKASGRYIQDILRRRVPSTIFHDSVSTYVHVDDVVDALLRAAEKPGVEGQKYLLGKYHLNGRGFANLVHEVSGVPLPLIHLPDFIVLAAAYLLTGISTVIRRAPLWGLSIDAAWTLKHGFQCDGSKAERELGITYSPVRKAMAEAISSYRQRWASRRR